MTVDNNNLVGSCDVGYSCAYSNTLSWLTPTLPFDVGERSARRVRAPLRVERQHGSARAAATPPSGSEHPRLGHRPRPAASAQPRRRRQHEGERLPRVAARRGAAHPEEPRNRAGASFPTWIGPSVCPIRSTSTCRLLYDLQVLAYQCDLTRVITFMYGREQSARTYPQLGISDPHHQLTHHQNDPEKLEKCTKIQTHHVALFTAISRSCNRSPTATGRCWINGAAVRRRPEQQRSPHARPVAHGGRGRRSRNDQGRTSSRLPGRDAAHQPARDAARQGRRAGRQARRQHGNVQGTIRTLFTLEGVIARERKRSEP